MRPAASTTWGFEFTRYSQTGKAKNMSRLYRLENGQDLHLAVPEQVEPCDFHGRDHELWLCRAAFGIRPDGRDFADGVQPLNFRLEGPPGVGKNEIVYE